MPCVPLLLLISDFERPPVLPKVRKPTDFGFVLDDMGNMPAMEMDATRIRGTDATVEVRYAFGKNRGYPVLLLLLL